MKLRFVHDLTPVRRRRYTPDVRSVADSLRARTVERVLALPIEDRIALAFSLGEDDLTLYVRVSGLDRAVALRHLRKRHAHGRRPSPAATIGDGP